jgi:hypothetical protein
MHSKKATQPHHNPYRLFIAFCCIYFLALPRLAIGQTQEQKTQAMTEILVEQKIEAERKQIDKAKQEILGKNNKSPALPGWIEIFAAIAGAAALFFVKSHFSTKRGGFKSEVQHLQPVRSADAKPPETLSATPA